MQAEFSKKNYWKRNDVAEFIKEEEERKREFK